MLGMGVVPFVESHSGAAIIKRPFMSPCRMLSRGVRARAPLAWVTSLYLLASSCSVAFIVVLLFWIPELLFLWVQDGCGTYNLRNYSTYVHVQCVFAWYRTKSSTLLQYYCTYTQGVSSSQDLVRIFQQTELRQRYKHAATTGPCRKLDSL